MVKSSKTSKQVERLSQKCHPYEESNVTSPYCPLLLSFQMMPHRQMTKTRLDTYSLLFFLFCFPLFGSNTSAPPQQQQLSVAQELSRHTASSSKISSVKPAKHRMSLTVPQSHTQSALVSVVRRITAARSGERKLSV